MISGEQGRFPAQVQVGHEKMGQELSNMGLKAEPVNGMYGGSPEKSYIVHNPSLDQLMDLGRRYGQESVVFSTGGKHQLVYTSGPNAGKFHAGTGNDEYFPNEAPSDNYTQLPGEDGKPHNGYLRLGFDWDSMHDLNPNGGQMAPAAAAMGKAEVKFIADQLRKALQSSLGAVPPDRDQLRKALSGVLHNRIEAYREELLALRKKETAEAAGQSESNNFTVDLGDDKMSKDVCPGCNHAESACQCLAKFEKLCRDFKKNEDCPPGYPMNMAEKSAAKPAAKPCANCNQAKCKCPGTVPGDKKSKAVPAKGSGGQVAKGKGLAKGESEEHCPRCRGKGEVPAISSGPGAFHNQTIPAHELHDLIPCKACEGTGKKDGKKAPMAKGDVPMAKPPSGKVPGQGAPPMSKPGATMAKADLPGTKPAVHPANSSAIAGMKAGVGALKSAVGALPSKVGGPATAAPKLPGLSAPKPGATSMGDPDKTPVKPPQGMAAGAGAKPATPRPATPPVAGMGRPTPQENYGKQNGLTPTLSGSAPTVKSPIAKAGLPMDRKAMQAQAVSHSFQAQGQQQGGAPAPQANPKHPATYQTPPSPTFNPKAPALADPGAPTQTMSFEDQASASHVANNGRMFPAGVMVKPGSPPMQSIQDSQAQVQSKPVVKPGESEALPEAGESMQMQGMQDMQADVQSAQGSKFQQPARRPVAPTQAPALPGLSRPKPAAARPQPAPALKPAPGLLGRLFGKSENWKLCPLCRNAEHLGKCS
jgi:hypothetical protein